MTPRSLKLLRFSASVVTSFPRFAGRWLSGALLGALLRAFLRDEREMPSPDFSCTLAEGQTSRSPQGTPNLG
jgi:hypothetical protein